MTTALTPHFALEELTFSSTAQRLGIDNTAPPPVLDHLGGLAQGLEKIRTLLKAPLHIDSGYRCPSLNKAVHGATASAHVDGWAADFTCDAFGSPIDIARAIVRSDIAFDQVIQEGTWVHVSFAPTLRREALTAKFGPGGATYTKGV